MKRMLTRYGEPGVWTTGCVDSGVPWIPTAPLHLWLGAEPAHAGSARETASQAQISHPHSAASDERGGGSMSGFARRMLSAVPTNEPRLGSDWVISDP
jgi:hypothetical protein